MFNNTQVRSPALAYKKIRALFFDTLTEAIASPDIEDGGKCFIIERTAGNLGGFTATVSSSAVPDTYSIIASTGVSGLSFVIDPNSVMDSRALGTVKDSVTDTSAAMQAYIDWCGTHGLEAKIAQDDDEAAEYRIETKISVSSAISIRGVGKTRPRFLCVNCDLFDYTVVGAQNVNITRIRAGQSTRHTTTPNTYFAVRFAGNTGNRPYYNTIADNFFDGFGRTFEMQWIWDTRFRDNTIVFCGRIMTVSGVSANCHITGNNTSGNESAFIIGDGTNTVEGYHIKDNLLDSFSDVGDFKGASFFQICGNIFDFLTGSTCLLIRSAGTLPSIGNIVDDNYFGINANMDEGIRLLNNLASAQNQGSCISNNEFVTYGAFTIGKAILTDGSNETKNIITHNRSNAAIADCDIGAATDCRVAFNSFGGAGFTTTVLCEYIGNVGTIISSTVLLKQTFGNITTYQDTAMPTSGTYTARDYVINLNPGIDANNMVLKGWIRLTTGSGHVLGTDWARDYASHVSPAN